MPPSTILTKRTRSFLSTLTLERYPHLSSTANVLQHHRTRKRCHRGKRRNSQMHQPRCPSSGLEVCGNQVLTARYSGTKLWDLGLRVAKLKGQGLSIWDFKLSDSGLSAAHVESSLMYLPPGKVKMGSRPCFLQRLVRNEVCLQEQSHWLLYPCWCPRWSRDVNIGALIGIYNMGIIYVGYCRDPLPHSLKHQSV